MMTSERPGYWDTTLAYIREGHRAYKEGDVASAVAVERDLGLSSMEATRFMQYLGRARADSTGPVHQRHRRVPSHAQRPCLG